MFNKILIVVDTSSDAGAVVEFAGQFKSLGTEECMLVQCIESREALYGVPADGSLIEQYKARLVEQDFKVSAKTIIGNLLTQINTISAEGGFSLVVVGALRLSIASEIFLFRISNSIIRQSVKPVFIVPLKKEKDAKQICLNCKKREIKEHILFPTDFSQNSDLAFSYLKEMVSTGAKKVTLFHVQDKKKIGTDFENRLEEFNRIDRERLKNFKNNLQGAKEVTIKIDYGSPLQEILKVVKEDDVTQVVMGSQGRGYAKEIFLGSVSHHVARSVNVPVMLIPMKR